ncbi:putative bifunctional diguanylate cyclase/phosphodiesterase [Parachitinimonas caeni]|uniref:EAL domain-containing protein n=1 Tax=Parachitinimonas caeni TaxID=3031301 RepID=A0ABT7DRA2_9NEIS|nr:EAL domain-containing protein [Parachitinimonas caeni]MDK2122596.1 EAL domain-containing protein [Parachitinimonas caeni]
MYTETSQPTVLLVDDKPSNLVALEALLDDGSRNIIAVTSGKEALRVLIKQPVALVLLDVQMPELDGIEVARLMRLNRRTRDIPVLMITAYGDDINQMLRGLQAGAIDYLCKPITSKILEAKVNNLLGSRQRQMDREVAHNEANKAKAFLVEILNTTGEGIAVLDSGLHLIYTNPAAAEILSVHLPAEPNGSLPFWCETGGLYDFPQTGTSARTLTHEVWYESDSNPAFPLQLSCSPLSTNQGWVLAFQDISRIKQLQATLKRIAITDALTGLLNRAGFFQAVAAALSKAQRWNKPLALMYLDLDHFKDVNDTHGHPVGDKLLTAFCKRLTTSMREYDVIGRIGGDEFAVLLEEDVSEEQVSTIAEKILKAQTKPYLIDGHSLVAGVSIGIAYYPDDGANTDQLLQAADVAMYQAKQDGRMSFRHHSPEMNARVRARNLLMESLYQAMEQNQFELLYQPQVGVADNCIHGVEALLRWHHPDAGMVSPTVFIPLLEESGLIVKVSSWILKAACKQRMLWNQSVSENLTIAVNLSAKQFSDELLIHQVEQLLDETGLPAHCLELEVTESTIIQNIATSQNVLKRLRSIGVKMAMDDFGTGYSSLAYLKQLPLDVLKIDRLFVANLQQDERDRAIARAIIGLAHELGLTVIAEGVESKEQYELLANMGCELIQGFYFSKPISSLEIQNIGLKRIIPQHP